MFQGIKIIFVRTLYEAKMQYIIPICHDTGILNIG